MNEWIYVLIMAAVQGVTEFLPVSSSGHLAVLGGLFGLHESESLTLGIVLHGGSLAAIAVFYFRELLKFFSPGRLRLLGLLVLGSIPAGVAGVALKVSGLDERLFGSDNLIAIGFAFLVTGSLLRLTGKEKLIRRSQSDDAADLDSVSVWQVLAIGVTQMFAILPGISRSGSTISCAMLAGVKREAAAAFSFLLAIPAIGGAVFLEMIKVLRGGTEAGGTISAGILIFGFAVSAAVSFASLKLLVQLIRKDLFSKFSYYLYGVGVLVIIWQFVPLFK